MDAQQQMKAKLEQVGLPYREINCYGAQIVVTCLGRETAQKWAAVLGKFATFRRIVESLDYVKENRGTMLLPTTIRVQRVFARV